MTPTIEQIKEILDGAPDGMNHIGVYQGDIVPMPNSCGDVHNLSDLRTILAQHEEIERLKLERESNYEKWQAKYRQLKDGLNLFECYECGTRVHELSPRSRCCMCEYGRANFNEKENDQLREQQK